MSARDRHHEVMALFDAACALAPAARDAFLDERCGTDAALRREVESLLEHDARDDALAAAIEHGTAAGALAARFLHDAASAPPAVIAGYRILGEIGRGGMGVIYEAEQGSPRRRVALKVLRAEMRTPVIISRFEREAHLLGRLQHPGIAQIHEAGVATEDGVPLPYLTMELIAGRPITTYATMAALSIADRLELVARVGDAVAHAHEQHVVHRDLKPSNILVPDRARTATATTSGADHLGQPKVLDFGVARLVDPDAPAATLHTEAGQIIGTLGYMSPEQLSGTPGAVDARSDVYALGVVLYEVLTGVLPLDLRGVPIATAAQRVRDEEPTRAGVHDRRLRGDVETIVSRMLEKEPARRYATMADAAADLRRAVQNQPILARPPSAGYRLRKFTRRHRGLVAGLVLTFVALTAGLVGTSLALVEANAQRDEARAARAEVDHVASFQLRMLSDTDLARLGIEIAREMRDELRRSRAGGGADAALAPDVAAAFDALLADVNFTNVARTTFKRQVIDRAAAELDADPPERANTHAQMRATLAATYLAYGLPQDARREIERALDLHDVHSADDRTRRFAMLRTHGDALVHTGALHRAVEVAAQRAAEMQQQYGADDARTLRATAQELRVRVKAGELDGVLERIDALLARQRARVGADALDALELVLDRARVLHARERHAEAIGALDAAITSGRARHGADHPLITSARSDLAQLLYATKRFDEAEAVMRETLATVRRSRGDDSYAALGAQNDLGMLLLETNRPADAEPHLRAALETRRRIKPDSSEAVVSTVNYAGLLFALDRPDDALDALIEASSIARRTLGPDHPTTLNAFVNTGGVLLLRERPADAIPYLRDGHRGFARLHPPEHRLVLASGVQFATALVETAAIDDAAPLAASLYATTRTLPNGRRARLDAAWAHASVLAARGLHEDAAGIATAARAESRDAIGAGHASTTRFDTLLASIRDAGD